MRPPLTISRLKCCGIREVASMPGFRKYSKSAFEGWLKRSAVIGAGENIPIRMLPRLYRYGNFAGGLLMATSTDFQREYSKWLSRVGFKKIRRFTNNNTGNMVNMYLYTLRNGERNVRG